MLSHVSIGVKDLAKARRFYDAALKPLGYKCLFESPEVARIRHCANAKCLWLFLDDSKNGSRRWCSMQLCGNRAKAHRHYLRGKTP